MVEKCSGLLLDFPNYDKKNAFLVFFLVFVVQSCMVVQHLATRRLKPTPSLPAISKVFSWRTWGIGVLVGSILGGLLSFITPFKPAEALAMAFVAALISGSSALRMATSSLPI